MDNLINTLHETRKPKAKRVDKHYPFNCTSKYYPLANSYSHEIRMNLPLPCGFLYGESWGALRKCWKGYRLAKVAHDDLLMREYATRIQTLQTQLGIPTAAFPNLGMMGDLFFLYDKEKEMELRHEYMAQNIRCDRYDIEGTHEGFDVKQLVEEGKAIEFDSELEYKRYKEQEHYNTFNEIFSQWANSESSQEFFKANQRRWNYREKIKDDLRQIKNELDESRMNKSKYTPNWRKLDPETRKKRRERREYLMQQKILKESEIHSVTTVQLVRTDTGWKYAKEILRDDYRRKKLYDYTPKYYLTDLAGHRLADYKEENETGVINDPYFYRLYLEDKEWEKIYQNEQLYSTSG